MGRVLVTGARGFVGTNLVRCLEGACDIVAADLAAEPESDPSGVWMDIRRPESVDRVLREYRPRAVIHAAGNKDVKACEADPGEAEATNALGTRNVAEGCARIGAKLIYLSTDLVFAGDTGRFAEDHRPVPSTVYGRSKLAGERHAREAGPTVAICRSGGIYGRRSPLLAWLEGELASGRPVEAFTDVYNTPTYVDNLAEMLRYVLEHDLCGTLHTVGRQRVNRFDLFRAYASAFGHSSDLVRPAEAAGRAAHLLQRDASLASEQTQARMQTIRFDSVAEGMERLERAGGIS